MKNFILIILLSLSLFGGDYFIGTENHLGATKKILYGNNGANYFVDEYTRSSLSLTFGIMDANKSYGLNLSKEYLNNDHKYGVGIFYRPVLSHLDSYHDINTSMILDTGINYTYKELSNNVYGASGFNIPLGIGLRADAGHHSVYTTTGFEFDFTFTHADEFIASRKYIYYGLYFKLGYQYRF